MTSQFTPNGIVSLKQRNEFIEMISTNNPEEFIEKLTRALTFDELFTKLISVENALNLPQKIVVLDLTRCDLEDFPLKLLLPNLKQLSLAYNKLKIIPPCLITSLDNVEVLDLSNNKLRTFLVEPKCVNKLKYLDLSYNQFKSVPLWILMLRAVCLEELNYSFNKVSNNWSVRNNKVQKLTLINSNLSEKSYRFLNSFRSLKCLDISNTINKIYNLNHNEQSWNYLLVIDELFIATNWDTLEIIKMNNLGMSFFPNPILWNINLVELYLNHNGITWLPNGIKVLKNLEILDISNNNLISLPKNILKLEKLRTIKAQYNSIASLPNLNELNDLTYLDLYQNLLDEITFSITGLTFLDLEMNYLDTNLLEQMQEYLKLKNRLRNCLQEIRDDGILPIPQSPDVSCYSSRSEDEDYDCYFSEDDDDICYNENEDFAANVSVSTYEEDIEDYEDWIFADVD